MFKTLALLAALFLVLMTAGAAVEPAALRAEGVPGFNARAAQARLRAIINPVVSHPVDTAAEDVVRANLLREITALGFRPEVHETFACRPQPRFPLIDCGHVRNVVFSIGPDHGPAVLAAGHYDSVPAGPGVTDDGIGMSVLLEVARELAHTPLHRRIIFLLSDGEEQALLGAYAFQQSDPLMNDVQALIELEARGTRGPAVFFETNSPNADALRTYANVARPSANSISANIYSLLPNSTDVTVLKRPGLDVVNIALLEGVENYHTPQDSFASQDLRSVQHMGDEALTVIRDWATHADRGENQDLVYTDILQLFFIAIPAWLSLALLAICALIAFAAFWRSGAERRWRALATPLVGLLLAALLGGIAWGAFALLLRRDEFYWWAHPEITRAWCVALGFLGLVLAQMTLGRTATAAQAEASGQFTFAALGALLSLALPGMSILYVVPAALYALGLIAAFAWKPAQPIGAVLGAIAALVIWAPMLALNELALGFQFPAANALLFALATLPWLGALARLLAGSSWKMPSLALTGAALAAFVAAVFTPSATRDRPLPLNVSYFFNTTSNEARILAGSAHRALPHEVSNALRFAPEIVLPGDIAPYWSAPAQAQAVSAPTLDGLTITPTANGRELHARLRSNGAYRLYLRIPESAHARHVRMNNAEADYADVGQSDDLPGYVMLGCEGRSCDGAEITMTLGATSTDWSIIGVTPGAAAPAQSLIAHRPPTRTPAHFGDNTVTLSTLRI
ncbi:MAG: M28 family peptidase [Vitreimonas sp.]